MCLVLFYLVLSLAILPEMGGGDWQSVRCRAKEAYVAAEPSKVRAARLYCAQRQQGARGG